MSQPLSVTGGLIVHQPPFPTSLHPPPSPRSDLSALMRAENMQVQLVFRAHMVHTDACGIGHTKARIMQNHVRAYKAKDL